MIIHSSGLYLTESGIWTPEPSPEIFFRDQEAVAVLRVLHGLGFHAFAVNVTALLDRKLAA